MTQVLMTSMVTRIMEREGSEHEERRQAQQMQHQMQMVMRMAMITAVNPAAVETFHINLTNLSQHAVAAQNRYSEQEESDTEYD